MELLLLVPEVRSALAVHPEVLDGEVDSEQAAVDSAGLVAEGPWYYQRSAEACVPSFGRAGLDCSAGLVFGVA